MAEPETLTTEPASPDFDVQAADVAEVDVPAPPEPGAVVRVRRRMGLLLFAIDAAAAAGLLWLACMTGDPEIGPVFIVESIPVWAIGTAAFLLLAANGLAYQSQWIASAHATFKDLFIASAGAVGVTSLFCRMPWAPQLGVFLGLGLLTSLARQVAIRVCGGLLAHRVLVLGLDQHSVELAKALPFVEEPKFRLIGFADDRRDESRWPAAGEAYLGNFGDAADIVSTYQVDRVVAALPAPGRPRIADTVAELTRRNIRVYWLEDFYSHFFNKIPVHHVDAAWALYGLTRRPSVPYLVVKRILDIVVAIIGLVLTGLFFPLVALLNRVFSPGPVVYCQTRVGKRGRPFRLYKFRTMVTDAERDGAQWARSEDERITPIGRLLRKTHLDELPQCWNVLRGQMSVVGPRPERPEFVDMLDREIPFFRLRHLVQPGITGLATVRNGYASSIEDSIRKTEYDLYYIKQRSSWLDLSLIFETFLICVLGRNGEGDSN